MSSRRPFLRRLPPMNAAARNVVPISPVGNSAIDAPAATLRSDGTLVQRVEQIPEMAAVDPTAGSNPIKAGVPEMRKMYEAALAGRL